MPCDNLAVQRASLKVDVAAEILASEPARKALLVKLQELLPGAKIDVYATESYLSIGTGRLTIAISRDGRMQVYGSDRALVASTSGQLESIANGLAETLATLRAVAGVKSKVRVTADVRTAAGARVLRAQIPLL